MTSLADEDLGPLIAMVRLDRGLDLTKYRDRYLRRRIGVRLRASGAHTVHHYIRLMRQDPREYEAFVSGFTIQTSSFLRNRGCFEALREQVFPEVAERAVGRRFPVIWSVGCGRGEEAYSLAMLASLHPEFEPADGQSPILATDIHERALAEARRGIYGRRAAAELNPGETEALFSREGRHYLVKEGVRRLVRFSRHDVIADPLPGRFLLVVCRNLLIYLERPAQEALTSHLADALVPGGFLVLGRSEILTGDARGRFVPAVPAERIYRKETGGEPAAAGIPPPRRPA